MNSNAIHCAFNKRERLYPKKCANNPSYTRGAPASRSLQHNTKSPYELHFSVCRGVGFDHKHHILATCKVTSVTTKHTCDMSSRSLRVASLFSRSREKFDIKRLSTVFEVLKLSPSLPAFQLRALLVNVIPNNITTDTKFLCNFRRRVRLYHASSKDALLLSEADVRQISSNINVTLHEMKVLTDKAVRLNYQAMYEQILHNDKDTWKTVAYLEKLKSEMYGFDFKIHYNKDGLPDAIVFMTHVTRRNLVRFGDIIHWSCYNDQRLGCSSCL